MCLPARMCSCVYASGLGPAEVVAGSLLHLVCFGSYVSQPICLLFLLHVLSLLASAASLSGSFIEIALRHWTVWGLTLECVRACKDEGKTSASIGAHAWWVGQGTPSHL